MRFKKIILLTIILSCLLAISAVSATNNVTENISGVEDTSDVISMDEINDTVSINGFDNNLDSSDGDYLSSVDGVFAQLNTKIQNAESGSIVKLTQNYAYVGGSIDDPYSNGISIIKPLTIDGNGVIIDGNNTRRIFNIIASNVTLKNITLKNSCCAISISGNNCSLNDILFTNNQDTSASSALRINGNKNTVSNCRFINNAISHSWIGTFKGGAVSVIGNNNIIQTSTFSNNKINIVAKRNAQMTAYCYGGALYLSGNNNSLISNRFSSNSIYCTLSSEYADNNNALLPKKIYAYGGAVYWEGDGNFINNDFYFSKITAESTSTSYQEQYSFPTWTFVYGGALYKNCSSSGGIIDKSSFMNNALSSIYKFIKQQAYPSTSTHQGQQYGSSIYWEGDNGKIGQSYFKNNGKNSIYFRGNDETVISSEIIGDSIYLTGNSGKINYNILKSDEQYIISGPKTTNIDYNWWGSNANPYNRANGPLCNDWLCTNLVVDDTNGFYPKIYTKLNQLPDGSFISDEDYAKLPIMVVTYTISGGGSLSSYSSDTSSNILYINEIGEYNIKVTSNVDNQITEITKKVSINRVDTTIAVSDYIVSFGDDLVVEVMLGDSDATGNVSLIVNNSEYVENITNNKATFLLPILNAGNYKFDAIYNGNSQYNSIKTTGSIIINKFKDFNMSANLQANNFKYGDQIILNITFSKNLTGTVSFDINNIKYTENVIDNKATFILNNLNAGKYEITPIYSGDINHEAKNTTIGFSISQLDSIVNVVVKNNITYGETATITITTNADGKVRIKIGTFETTVDVINKTALINVPNLNADNEPYSIEALFYDVNNNCKNSTGFATLKVSKANPIFNIIVNDINYGEQAIMNVFFKKDINGFANIVIKDNNDFELKFSNLIINNGELLQDLTKLDVSKYTITFEYLGNNNYNSTIISKSFNVFKCDPIITVTVTNATYGQTAKITANSNAEGNITINIGTDKTYNELLITDGRVSQNVNDIDAGTYDVKVTYNGNNNYNIKTVKTKLTIYKVSTTVIATADDITYQQTAVVNVKASVNGEVTVKIDNNYINSTNVVANTVTPITFNNIPAGVHNISVLLTPSNKNYKESSHNTDFTVSKKLTSITLGVENSVYGEEVIINVTASEDGKITLKVGSITRAKNVLANTMVKINFGVLAADSYNVEATFNEGENFKPSTKQTILVVSPAKAQITAIQVQNNTYGENTLINVKTNVAGVLTVKINNTNTQTFNIDANKLTSLDLGKYDAGYYDIALTLDAGSNYTKGTGNAKVTVNPKQTTVELNVNNNLYGKNVVVNVTASENGKITVKVGTNVRTVDVEANKCALVDFGILDAKSYEVNATFDGGKNYQTSSDKTYLVVSPKASTVTFVDFDNSFVYAQNVIIKMKSDTVGILTVKVGDTPQTKQVTTGNAVTFDFGILDVNNYDVTINLDAGDNYVPFQNTTSIAITPKSTTIALNTKDYDTSENVIVNVTASENGKVTIKLGGLNKSIDVNANEVTFVDFGLLDIGLYDVVANFTAGNNYINSTDAGSVKVLSKIKDDDVNISIPQIVANQENQMVISLPSDATGTVTLIIGNNTYSFTVDNGVATVKVPKLEDGTYEYIIKYSGDNNYSSYSTSGNIDVSKPAPDVEIPPLDKPSSDGSITINLPQGATGTVTLVIDKKPYSFPVQNGVAKIYLPEMANGNYPYTITYSGDGKYSSFTKTGNVTINKQTTPAKPVTKTTLTLKKVKVKRSAKKLTIQATLKINGKAVKGKLIKFKFNKKSYKAKTNAKGVAKITVKKSVLKKLKKGKKVTYTATYDKITKKVTVKVK